MTSKIKAYDVNGIQINVGDPVMCVGDAYWLTVGETYTVESISESGEFVRVVGDNGIVDGWGGSNFRIVKTDIRNDIPEAFADDLVTAKWKSGDSDETWAELLRVACMEGAHVVGTQSGVTYSGLVFAAHSDSISIGYTSTGGSALVIPRWGVDWTITATAPKPADPTGGDPVVRASLVAFVDDKQYIFFRAQDGRWSKACDPERGMWDTGQLTGIERLSAQTIAELMGGE